VARRPELLDELLRQAEIVVVAEVVAVISTGPKPPAPDSPYAGDPHASGVGYVEPEQRLRLKVGKLLRGSAASELEVVKPVAPYRLQPGDGGAFLISAGDILGRYGPDTYREEAVTAALRHR